jgi:hypothetical protein
LSWKKSARNLTSSARRNKKNKKAAFAAFFVALSEKVIIMFRLLAKINRLLLPSFTKRQMDMGRAKKWQLAVIGWRYYVTVRALDEESKLKSLR